MGYRNYIGEMSRVEYETIMDMTEAELINYTNENDYVCCWTLVKDLYEFGKYVEFGDAQFMTDFFSDTEMNSRALEDGEFYLVGPEFLRHVIEYYTNKTKSYFRDLVDGISSDDITEEQSKKLLHEVQKKLNEWGEFHRGGSEPIKHGQLPYSLDDSDDVVVTSWLYEYGVFELVRIYKTFDWDNKVMVYYGA